jgi:hypothetical protein
MCVICWYQIFVFLFWVLLRSRLCLPALSRFWKRCLYFWTHCVYECCVQVSYFSRVFTVSTVHVYYEDNIASKATSTHFTKYYKETCSLRVYREIFALRNKFLLWLRCLRTWGHPNSRCDSCVLRCTVTGKLRVCIPRGSFVWNGKCLSFFGTFSVAKKYLCISHDAFKRKAESFKLLGNFQ